MCVRTIYVRNHISSWPSKSKYTTYGVDVEVLNFSIHFTCKFYVEGPVNVTLSSYILDLYEISEISHASLLSYFLYGNHAFTSKYKQIYYYKYSTRL